MGTDEKMDHARSQPGAGLCGAGHHVSRQTDPELVRLRNRTPAGRRRSAPVLTERRGNAMLSSPTAMGITGFTGLPSATRFSISPSTCQGQAAHAVAAFAGIQWRRHQAPGITCASQFACLQKILNTAHGAVRGRGLIAPSYSIITLSK